MIREDTAEAPPPASSPPRSAPWPWVVGALGILLGVGAVAVALVLKSTGPPGLPQRFAATARTCVPPECDYWRTTVALTWEAPAEGGAVTAYRVFRNGRPLRSVSGSEQSYVDRGLIPGLEYRYAIQAVGEAGSSSRSEPVAAKPPIPAVGEARLDGVFKVVATVRSAGLLKTLIGIDDPGAGDQTALIWPIKASCPAAQGACGAKWRRKDPPLDRNGGTYSGKVVTREAQCGGSEDRFPATNYLSLRVTKAEIQGFILVAMAFEGTLEVTFRCEGRRVRGVVRVAGRAT